ncbi:MAG: glycosyltransferase [Flavobacteriales bacterium]
MKIALVGTTFPFRGGIANFNDRLCQQLNNENHQVDIYTFTVQYPKILFPGKTQLSSNEKPKELNIIRSIHSLNPFSWLITGNRIKNKNYDIVIIPFWLPLMSFSLAIIARIIKNNRQTQLISIAHNIIPHESRLGDKFLTKFFIKPIDKFMVLTKKVMYDLHQFNITKQCAVSPHPVYDNFGDAIEQDKAIKKLGLHPKFNYILFFGLIRDYKGLDLLIEAMARIRTTNQNIKLIIAGEYYSDKSFYDNLINKLNLNDCIIQFDKYIPDNEVSNIFCASDLVVQPYKTATQSGVTQIAYHFEKPMIVTDVGGLKEMCPHEKVGFVVQPNKNEIANAINRFYEKNLAKEMEKNIQFEKQKYSWSIFTEKLLSLKDN